MDGLDLEHECVVCGERKHRNGVGTKPEGGERHRPEDGRHETYVELGHGHENPLWTKGMNREGRGA